MQIKIDLKKVGKMLLNRIKELGVVVIIMIGFGVYLGYLLFN